MQIDLDTQEREVIKQYARQMFALFRREIGNGTANATGADAMTLAFWERLEKKMDVGPQPKVQVRSHVWS
jgi:hypothetical protein